MASDTIQRMNYFQFQQVGDVIHVAQSHAIRRIASRGG